MLSYKDTVAKGETFASVEVEKARDYAAEDAHVTWLLDGKLGGQIIAFIGLIAVVFYAQSKKTEFL